MYRIHRPPNARRQRASSAGVMCSRFTVDNSYRVPVNNDLLYLRPNVQVEPLFDYWYAWSHLIPPTTAARNLTEQHFKIMDSYVNTPQIHANTVKNPKLLK